jgi:hypothetical protein
VAVYPSTLPIDQSRSRRVLRDGRQSSVDGDGAARIRKVHADAFDFEIEHPRLDSAQLATLLAFYQAQSLTSQFTLVWPEDGEEYAVRFRKNALQLRRASPGRVNAVVRLGCASTYVDPYLADVILLMRMEGADGSQSFVDSGPLALTCTATGTPPNAFAQISNAQAKSGATSCKCDANYGHHLRATNTAAAELSGDFTAEAWVYLTATPDNSNSPFGLMRSGPFPLCPIIWTDSKLYLNDNGDKITGTTTVTLNAWHHVAVTRGGTTCRLWLDGAQEGGTYTSSYTYCIDGNYTYVGSAIDGGNQMGQINNIAYVDLLRITAADRYGTGGFTPPADY